MRTAASVPIVEGHIEILVWRTQSVPDQLVTVRPRERRRIGSGQGRPGKCPRERTVVVKERCRGEALRTARKNLAFLAFRRSTSLRTAGIVLLCTAAAMLAACGGDPQERQAVEALMEHRTARDRFMASADSPLTPEQRGRFKGLAYFKPNFDLVFESELQVVTPADTVRMLTTTGGIDLYLRYATFPFEFAGQSVALTVFRGLEAGHLFLPFTDATSGEESYGAARYIDLQPVEGLRYRLDFNLAYNPYCAYNPKWACPIAPPENHLAFAVRAGERKYPYAQHDTP